MSILQSDGLVRGARGALIIIFGTIKNPSLPLDPTLDTLGVLLACFASGMALQVALVACEARVTLRAVSIFFAGGCFVTSTNAVRAATRHAHTAMESNLTTVKAVSVNVTLVGFAIVWATLANPAIFEEAFERVATLHTCLRLPSFAIAAFWTGAFWAWLITEITPPASVAAIVAFAAVFFATTTFAATGALLLTFVSKEAVFAVTRAQSI
jgi:hypothetical protein